MALRPLVRRLTGPAAAGILSAALLVALVMLSAAAQHSETFGPWYTGLLGLSVAGLAALGGLIAVNLHRLLRQARRQVLGSRLTLRLVLLFVVLTVLPLGVVYFISVQFLHRGIDSWFDVRIEQALDDALLLGRASLEAIKEERVRRLQEMATGLELVSTPEAAAQALDDLREQGGFTEATLLTADGRFIASSNLYEESLIPTRPEETVLSRLRQGRVYANLEPSADGSLELRIVVPVRSLDVQRSLRLLQVIEPLPLRYSKLGESVQSAFKEYEKLVYLRGPLKLSFVLTLTLVTLITGLVAAWAAIYSARRLTAPMRDLAEGTRAVAAGDYDKQLPAAGGDELGVLVASFNEMTRRIRQAQQAARRAQREAEAQRAYLETVLAHLSSGVLSFSAQGTLRTLNQGVAQLLGVDLAPAVGRRLGDLGADYPQLEPLWRAIQDAVAGGHREWQAEVALFGPRGRQIIMCRGTRISAAGGRAAGHVVVFDDVTALIQAQRDAAWREVARRLAHEIKNPLTPIQLSAERIRHKYLAKLPEADRAALDRATRTIADQVEAMKSMVNAFSNYAQLKHLQPEPTDLNRLVQDVAELHRGGPRVALRLAPDLPRVPLDRGRLRQVLHNLLINARDALGGTGGTIEVGTRRVAEGGREFVELWVADDGPGFPAEIMDRLFEPYVTTKAKGNGLGLAIVKKITEEHGGVLWARNREGGGAQVLLRLPLAPRDADNTRHTGAGPAAAEEKRA